MTPAEIISLIGDAWWDSRRYWQHLESQPMDALSIVQAIVDAGLASDDRIGPLSLEARIIGVLDRLNDTYDGQLARDDVGAEIAYRLGLVSHEDASGFTRLAAA